MKFNSGVWYPCKQHVGSSAEAEWSLNPSNFIQCCRMRGSLPSINTMCSSSWFYLILSKLWLSPQKIMPYPSCSFLSPSSFLVLGLCFLFTFGFVSLSLSLFFLVSLLFSFSFWFCWASQHQCLSFPATAGLSQKLKRLVNVWNWSPPTVGSWWSQRGFGSWWIPYMLGLWTCLWLLLLLNLFLSFGFCFLCSLDWASSFSHLLVCHQIYKISTTLLSGHISILFRLTWITSMEKFFILMKYLFLCFDLLINQILHCSWCLYAGECQVCVIGNLCPETVEEAKAVVPSIAVRFWTCCFVFGFHSCVY